VAEKYFSERNIKFLLYEVFDLESLTQYDYFAEGNKKIFDMVLQAAKELAEKLLHPIFEEMDRNPPGLEGDTIKVHPSVKNIMREYGQGGWVGTTLPEEHGGEQLPHLLSLPCHFIFAAANYSATVFSGLTAGAAHLIESFASKELFDTYVPRMLSGEWQGTMALTEPEAGSSLSDIITTAFPTDQGYYKIKGQKIFISGGDHDGVENVIHLMLAKIEGAPPGTKGISLFVVPKKRLDDRGKLVSNDVVTSGMFHKMGYKGCPIAQLSIGDKDDCRGFLVGEPHNGLRYMFQMMNGARIGVGMGATAIATAAYYSSLDYAQKRRQGRKLTEKDPSNPPILIIEHPDVKRMLLFQRAIVEGSLSISMQCARYVDLQKVTEGEEKEKYHLLLEILTPIAKAYPSEMALPSISLGLQCLGGSGYCDDYPLEQYYRDVRIHPIHEGTTGIQGLDLLGRKVIMQNGQAFKLYMDEVTDTIRIAGEDPELREYSEKLDAALNSLKNVTMQLISIAQKKSPEYFLADATLYLEFFGIITVAWQWLLQGIAILKSLKGDCESSDLIFYKGKLTTMRFFFSYELPKIHGLAQRLKDCDGLTVDMDLNVFDD
jgi:alkylation response protein AidB-like acyl-CoA dehydrogenase